MTLGQALALVQKQKEIGPRRKLFLASGFQALHLATFLEAHYALRFPEEAADILTGLYGDLEGTLATSAASPAEAAAVVVEWSDLDSRLGLRSAGGWGLSAQQDILENCRGRFTRLLGKLETLASRMPVALVPPTLPIPLLGHTAGWQISLAELELEQQAARFLADSARIERVSILHPAKLAQLSPVASRLDPLMELQAGFPYTIQHASMLAGQLVKLLFPPSPMKGLITDLDETLWSGIVGEVGAQAVSWGLAEHAQVHGMYQQMLRHLSEMGVLLAIASKNEMKVVEEALRREDLRIPASAFYPVRAGWGPKSQQVAEILRTWNIDAASVVFVDDSPMELDEVRTAFPSMTCLQFSKKPATALELFEQLRDRFGKPAVHRDDALRQASIRARQAFDLAAENSESGEFVRSLRGKVTFDARKNMTNRRQLELINKTNQFNLNGVRLSEGEWMKHLEDECGFAIGVSYEDRFGPLGTVGVMAGRRSGDCAEISSWVLSCRAFSRKIEHHMLEFLFRQPGLATVKLCFHSTERNQPLRQFLQSIGWHDGGDGGVLLSREQLSGHLDDLPHQVVAQENE